MSISRRELLQASLAASAALALGGDAPSGVRPQGLHEYLLDLAGQYEKQRRARFAAVSTATELAALQKSLREKFLQAIGGLPESRDVVPPVKITGAIEAEGYRIEKLLIESLPGYFVTALLYRPTKEKIAGQHAPGVISPCGHSATGKAADTYQTLHVNLARRGYFVLTYDPVGQAERSQFWDAARGRSKFNLVCGEHAVLGNPLYTLGENFARYRIWDGMRALDYLSSLAEVDSRRLACVGNSGGGALTAYLAALDERIRVAAICCYITTLPRRMATRVAGDPDADPEQDIFGMLSQGIDHAGLLALRAPRPTLLGVAQLDFFPVAGARESFVEAQHLFEVAGAKPQVEKIEASEKHGLSLPLRQGVYRFFDRWLMDGPGDRAIEETAVAPRTVRELQVTADGQVNLVLGSRHLLTLAWEEFRARSPKPAAPATLLDALRLGADRLESAPGGPKIEVVAKAKKTGATLFICINGNESPVWQQEAEFNATLVRGGHGVAIVDLCGVGSRRVALSVKAHEYADPLVGVEADLAYNAFAVGKSLLGLRVADVLDAVARLADEHGPGRIVVCGRRDAALVACFAAAVESRITHLAVEEMLLGYQSLFDPMGRPINAASILPGLLRGFGDVADVLQKIVPRRVLLAKCGEEKEAKLPDSTALVRREKPYSRDAALLLDWLET